MIYSKEEDTCTLGYPYTAVSGSHDQQPHYKRQASRLECVLENYFLNQNICCEYSKEPSQ